MPSFYQVLIQARDEASGTFQKVAREAEKASRAVDRASAPRAGLSGLKSQFGEDSQFGLAAKTAVGAGALAGVSIASNALGDFGEAVRDASRAYRSGEKTMDQVVAELAKGLPVLGGVFRAADAFADVILESTESFKAFAADQKANAAAEAERKRMAGVRAEQDRVTQGFADFDAGLKDPQTAAERRTAQFDAEMRRLDELEKRDLASDPSGGGARAMQRRVELQEELAEDLKKIEADEQRQREQAFKDHEKRIADIQAQANEQRLRNAGDTFGAEREALKRQAEADKEAATQRSVREQEELEKQGNGAGALSRSIQGADERAAIQARLDADLEAVNKRERDTLDKRVDSSLDDFFSFEDDDPEFRRGGGPRRFADAVESRGTGVGAAAREGTTRDPQVEEQKKTNDHLKQQEEAAKQFRAKAERFFTDMIAAFSGGGFDGAGST